MTILILISALVFMIMAAMVILRVAAIRNGRVATEPQVSLHDFIQKRADSLAVYLVLALKDTAHFLSLQTLLVVGKGLSKLKVYTAKVEKKFSKIVDLVHGKGVAGKRGSASLYLLELKRRKEKFNFWE